MVIQQNALIPGHVYLENTGTELIYVGVGTCIRVCPTEPLFNWGSTEPAFLYMKKQDVEAKLADGRLSKDFSLYDGRASGKKTAADFWRTVYISKKPRKLTSDLGTMFPAGFFTSLDVKDVTCDLGDKELFYQIRTAP